MRHLIFTTMFFALNLPAIAESPARDEISKLRFAASQHEIITILIEEQNYAGVLPEFRRILKLDLKGERNEKLIVKSAWAIVEQLSEARQYALAHQILEETLEQTENRENRFSLLMLKGKTLKDEGRLREAIEVYRKAQALQD